jgi:hypothetical protein
MYKCGLQVDSEGVLLWYAPVAYVWELQAEYLAAINLRRDGSSRLLTLSFLAADLQLDVKGCKDVYDSFDKYVEVEKLEGENKYHAEQYGLQV